MTRVFVEYVVIALFVGVLALAGYSAYLSHRLDSVSDQKETATATAAGYKTYATEHRKVQEQKEATNYEVHEALERHPDWADEPVPAELADKLRDRGTK